MDVVNEYLTSPHRVVKCTVKLQKSEKRTKQLKVPKKFRGASEGTANDNDKENPQDVKQNIRYLVEGIDEETKHFEVCLREAAAIWGERHEEAEAIVHNKIIKVVTGNQNLSMVGECMVEQKRTRSTNREHCLKSGTPKRQEQQKAKI